MQELVLSWFDNWQRGDLEKLPITEEFIHTSPFGEIVGKQAYLKLVNDNLDKFLGYTFTIHDALYGKDSACTRYTAINGVFSLDVSEWYKTKNGLISHVIAYYHIGEIRQERQLK